jgi:hypothetical protein
MAMLEAGEAAEMTESEEVASNEGWQRGLKAGQAKAAKDAARNQPSNGAQTPDVSMREEQAITWSLLMVLGIVVVWVSPWGKWLSEVVKEITTYHETKLDFNPLSEIQGPPNPLQNIPGIGGLFHGANQPADSGGGTSLFNVPITNANGEPGSIQVVAHDSASAVGNASQGGNTPTGPATPA